MSASDIADFKRGLRPPPNQGRDELTKDQAKKLAVRYHAYLEAIHSDDNLGIVVWGPMLEEIQNETNLVLLSKINVRVEIARREMNEAA